MRSNRTTSSTQTPLAGFLPWGSLAEGRGLVWHSLQLPHRDPAIEMLFSFEHVNAEVRDQDLARRE